MGCSLKNSPKHLHQSEWIMPERWTPIPDAECIFVVDRLNTHQSESLVKFVTERCGLPDAWGKKPQRYPEIDGDA